MSEENNEKDMKPEQNPDFDSHDEDIQKESGQEQNSQEELVSEEENIIDYNEETPAETEIIHEESDETKREDIINQEEAESLQEDIAKEEIIEEKKASETKIAEQEIISEKQISHKAKFRWALFLGILLIFAAGTFLRFYGIKFGFPGTFRPDEEYYVHTVLGMDAGDLNPKFYYYPSFYFYFNLIIWRTFEIYHFFMKSYDPNVGIHSFIGKHTQTMYLMGRCVGAILGALTILITYLIGKRFYGGLAGFLAALFIAFNPVHSLNSHFFKSDVATAFFMTLSLYYMLVYLKEGKRTDLYLAAGIGGIAFSTNYYGGFLMIPLALTLFLRAIREHLDKKKNFFAIFISPDLYISPLFLIVIFVLTSPYIFLDFQSFLKHFSRMVFSDRVNLYNTFVGLKYTENNFQKPLIYSLQFCLRHTTGIALAVISLLSILYMLIRFSMKNLVILSFLLSYFFLIATGKAVFTRYYAPIAPTLSLICAVFIAGIGNRFLKRKSFPKIIIFSIFIILITVEPAYVCFKQSQILSREDTRIIAARWIKENLPPGPTFASLLEYRYGKPILTSGGSYIRVQPTVEATYKAGARYILIDTYALNLYSPNFENSFLDDVYKNAELIKTITFSPTPEKEKPVVDVLDAFYLPIHKFGNIERPGPEIKIFKILPDKFSSAGGYNEFENLNAKRNILRNNTQNGLRGKYFSNLQSNGEPVERIDPQINFNWNDKAPMTNFPKFGFSVIWDGYLVIPTEDTYTFYLTSDDGSKLWLDEELLINNWSVQAPREMAAIKYLKEGIYPIKIAYFQDSYGSMIQLEWSSGGGPKQIIPSENLQISDK